VKSLLTPYRVMATVVGVLLIVLILIGVPLANFDGSSMWGIFPSTPELTTPGSDAHQLGEWITHTLGVAHGWLYMIFLLFAFMLSRRAEWSPGFTVVTLLAGTVPILSFWAEHRATRDVRARIAAEEAQTASPGSTTGSGTTADTGADTGA
jgi:integral membrane protein